MTDPLDVHMRDQTVIHAQAALDAHRLGPLACPACAHVPHQRALCPEGQRLHTAVVQAAQDAYRAAHPEAFAPEPHDG